MKFNEGAAIETSVFSGGNSAYLEGQYEQYLKDPNSVDESWRDYFARLPMVGDNARDIPHSDIREHFYQLTRVMVAVGRLRVASDIFIARSETNLCVSQLINAYRVRGHQLAKTDPLGQVQPPRLFAKSG